MNQKIMVNVGKRYADYELLKKMALAGMDIARLNFSHATNDQLIGLKENLAKVKQETGKDVKIIQDLCGPRIRVGVLPHDMNLQEGQVYSFSFDKCGTEKMCIPINDKGLINDIKVGHSFYIADGTIGLVVQKIEKGKIYAMVERGGYLLSNKGINVPMTNLSGGGLTKKDEIDAAFGAEQKVDYIGLSFVQNEKDVIKLRKIIGPDIKIIAQIKPHPPFPYTNNK